jgi:shikimate kinase
MTERTNFVLIGMPSAGKSTLGVLLAKLTSRGFVDTDLLIQLREGRSLPQILDEAGYQALRRIEEQVLLDVDVRGHVIATGGSAVYSDPAMEHLRRNGLIIYLDQSLDTLRQRLTDMDTRGIAMRPGQSLEELFQERSALYRRAADLRIDCDKLTPEGVCELILAELKARGRANN